jgi:hypothetical protein
VTILYQIHYGTTHAWYPNHVPSLARRSATLILSECCWMVPGTGEED